MQIYLNFCVLICARSTFNWSNKSLHKFIINIYCNYVLMHSFATIEYISNFFWTSAKKCIKMQYLSWTSLSLWKKKSFGIFKWIAHSCLYLFIIKFTSVFTVTDLNTSYLTDLHIVFTLKMESVYKNTIVGLKMKVKSGLEKIFLKFLYAEDYFHLLKCPKSQIH